MQANPYSHILTKYPPRREYVLQMLIEIQNADPQNYLPVSALKAVVNYTNLSMSAIMGVAQYYSNLSLKPRGRFVINICHSPVCIHKNPELITQAIFSHYSIAALGKTSPDGLISVDYCECLGRCAEGITVTINGHYIENPTALTIVLLIENFIKTQQHD